MTASFALWLCASLMVTSMTEAFSLGGKTRCLCAGKMQKGFDRNNVLNITVYPKSPSCDRVEILLIRKQPMGPVCLDPNSPNGKLILKKKKLK
ncbi:hypothetical protein JZ751_001847 [Albula glossodonta]|nr:hypothetical protein JZ751_001847 [Albula glossodonta]